MLKTEKTVGNPLVEPYDDDNKQIENKFINMKENTPILMRKNYSKVKN